MRYHHILNYSVRTAKPVRTWVPKLTLDSIPDCTTYELCNLNQVTLPLASASSSENSSMLESRGEDWTYCPRESMQNNEKSSICLAPASVSTRQAQEQMGDRFSPKECHTDGQLSIPVQNDARIWQVCLPWPHVPILPILPEVWVCPFRIELEGVHEA